MKRKMEKEKIVGLVTIDWFLRERDNKCMCGAYYNKIHKF